MIKKLTSDRQILVDRLHVAQGFWERAVGLLGRKALPGDEGLLIPQCNAIHTFGMRFAIDCIFIDAKGVVRKIFPAVKPWRMTLPVWRARAVIEVSAGQAERLNLREGDQLYVRD